jgi:hypothetical protein
MLKFEKKNPEKLLSQNNPRYLGTIGYKDTPEVGNRRYLWIEYITKELRWSVGSVPHNPCKRLSLSNIQSISKVTQSFHHGFNIQSKSHSLLFWLPDEKEVNAWMNEINAFIVPDENSRAKKKRVISSTETIELQAVKNKVISVLSSYIPNLVLCKLENIPCIVKEYLDSMLVNGPDDLITPETKSLKDQVNILQGKIKNMEEVKIEHEKYAELEQEYNSVKAIGIELSNTLDKLQADKALLSRDSRQFKNELSIMNAWNKQNQSKKSKILSDLVTINNEKKLAAFISDINALYLYHPIEFICTNDKYLYSMISNMQIYEDSWITITLSNGTSVNIQGQAQFLKEIKTSFEKYQILQNNSAEKQLVHYFSVCEENERQLRTIEAQVRVYKKTLTVNIM